MLVDFQKAFESVSWVFLSDVFKFFNFGKKFKRCLDVLNKNVQASILQSDIYQNFLTYKGLQARQSYSTLHISTLCSNFLSYDIV